MQDDDLVAKEVNEFFKNDVSTLNINENIFISNKTSDDLTDPIEKDIEKHKFYLRILLIQKHFESTNNLSF